LRTVPDGPTPTGVERNGESLVPLDAPQMQIAARHPERVERVAAGFFLISVLAFAGFGAAYWQAASGKWLGVSLGIGAAAFGAALVSWGKYLMPQGPFEEPRKMMAVAKEQRDLVVGDFVSRGKVAIDRRGFLVKLMGAAAGIFGIVAVFPLLRSLGPVAKKQLYTTAWRKGSYLTTLAGQRVTVNSVNVGGILTVFPQNDIGGALSQTVLIRLQQSGNVVTRPGRETWGPHGFVAFSKVCTHAGCPVSLYEELTQQLLCPCHQSLFDVRDGCEPIFGPAPRPLAQLPLYVDSAGNLRAQRGYDEPIGPGFWSRGGTA
jgi:ubiquinol-cytochrome c reductase iron-sulfur subunit